MAEFTNRLVHATLCAALVLAGPATELARAQDPSHAVGPDAPIDTSKKYQTLFTQNDALLGIGFVGLTFAMFPLDRKVAKNLADEFNRKNRFLQQSATGLEGISSPGAYIIGGGLYAAGRLTHNKNIADLGWHGTEAVLLSSVVTGVLKGTLGRARPFVVNDTNPRDFKLLKGFSSSDRQSFPSGHTTTAFAAAAAVTSEVQHIWPRATWYVAPLMYTGATLVGLSRMYHNKHWASDVVLGAGVGTFSGIKVVRYSHAHPDNKLDRIMMNMSVVPGPDGGGALAFRIPVP
jgi:membrane-associated phospholipid phosphatase